MSNNWIDEHFKKREILLDSMNKILELREKALSNQIDPTSPWKKVF